MTDSERPSGPLDVTTLEAFARRATTHPLVTTWVFRPDSISPRVLELELDAGQYPDCVRAARLDVRWFVGDDYTIHYLENTEETRYECRWDRHPKPDAPRAHYHPPPDAASAVEPSRIDGETYLGVCFHVLEWVETRVRNTYR